MLRAALVSVLVVLPLVAAPVPPAPKELTADLLVGSWRYEYGTAREGRIWLHADGTYASRHAPDAAAVHCGDWRVERGVLVLDEYLLDPEMGRTHGPTQYRFVFNMRDYPRLVGASNGTVRVALSDPRR